MSEGQEQRSKIFFICKMHLYMYIYIHIIHQSSMKWPRMNGFTKWISCFFTAFFFKGFYGWLEITVENNTNTFHLILKCLLWIRWYHFNHKVWSILWKESSLGPSISYVVSKLEILTPSHPPLAVFFIKQGCCNSRYPQGQHPC